MTGTESAMLASIVDALAGPGWAAVPQFVGRDVVATLAAELDAKRARGDLREAAVGAGANRAVRREVRGDLIQWLDGGRSAAEQDVLARLERLRVALNAGLQLGLHELECHYALYP